MTEEYVRPEHQSVFPPFRLDAANERLWCKTDEIRLRGKTFAVLRFLVGHPGQLVTKAALLDAVWPETSVSDTMPTICISELRKALGDQVKMPRFIETVHGRGYRFIAKVTTAAPDATMKRQSARPLYHMLALRLRGELRLRRAAGSKVQTELAQQDFREAIDLARTMGAKGPGLHATMSLARLLGRQGRREEASNMLAETYNSFTEGCDTADLKEAKALLDALIKKPGAARRLLSVGGRR
jgi:DNA-binding winged helix-turn-helix (wHTH) protein